MKSLAFVHRNDTRFAVGDFSPVLSVFSYHELGTTVSPFLLLDHLGPGRLLPSTLRRGVNPHPHRGFETVTLAYAGELEHQDTSGGGGIIRPGDVQWMTAGRGIVHEERFSAEFSRQGGRFEFIQLWVNLPARAKLTAAAYQSLTSADIPVVTLADGTATIRVIAGRYGDAVGPARTHTRIGILDVRMTAGRSLTLPADEGDTALVYLRGGLLRLAGEDMLEEEGMAVMSSRGSDLQVTAIEDSRFLLLTGEPLGEPVVGNGPFVMNSYEEIVQAFDEFRDGRFMTPNGD